MKTDETVIKCSARFGGKKTEWKTYIKHIDFYHSYYKAVIETDACVDETLQLPNADQIREHVGEAV